MEHRWRVLALASTSAFMVYLDVTVLNIAFPSIERSFAGTPAPELSWVLNAYSIVFAALLIAAARMGEQLGRRRSFLAGLLVFVAGSAGCALAPAPGWLMASRIIQAVGATLVPASQALLMAEFPRNRRSLAVGLWGAAAGLAAAVGPALGGVVVDGLDWRWVFVLNLPVGLVAWIAGRRLLTEHKSAETGLPDFLGAALVTFGIAALALGIVEGHTWGWGSARTVAALASAAGLLVLFVWRSARHPRPVLDLTLLRTRSVAVANAATVLVSIAFFASLLGGVLFLMSAWHYSALRAGLALTPAPVAGAVVAGPAGRLADRYGHRVIAVPGAMILAAAGAWYATRLGPRPALWSEWFLGTLLAGVGLGLAYSTLASAAVIRVSADRFGIASGLSAMSRQLGGVLGVAATIAIVGSASSETTATSFDGVWRLIAVVSLGAAAVSLGLGRTASAQEAGDRPLPFADGVAEPALAMNEQ